VVKVNKTAVSMMEDVFGWLIIIVGIVVVQSVGVIIVNRLLIITIRVLWHDPPPILKDRNSAGARLLLVVGHQW